MQQNILTPVTPLHTGVKRFLDACHHREPDATPVWFMRQAGRSLAEFREVRKHYDLLTIAKTPELCAEVTLMPVKRLGVDGAVLLADIVIPLEDMGISLELQPDVLESDRNFFCNAQRSSKIEIALGANGCVAQWNLERRRNGGQCDSGAGDE